MPASCEFSMQRVSATIPDIVYDRLVKLAEYEGRSLSNLIAHLLERNIEVKLRSYQVAGEKVPKV